MQARQRAERVCDTIPAVKPAGIGTGLRGAQHTSSLSSGGFAAFNSVLPAGTFDTDSRRQRRLLPTPGSNGPEYHPTGVLGGRLHLVQSIRDVHPEGKRTFTERQPDPTRPAGVRRVVSEVASCANPNVGPTSGLPPHPEGKRSYPAHHKAYRIYVGQELPHADRSEGVAVTRDANGEALRSKNTPVAWPKWPGYPPNCNASGKHIDYALSKHEHRGFRAMPEEHPDLRRSRQNRLAAADPSYTNQQMRCRHAGEYSY